MVNLKYASQCRSGRNQPDRYAGVLSGENAVHGARLRERNGIPYLTFPLFDQYPFIVHGFSTKLGGVSEGEYASMNLSYSRGDKPERVTENYHRIAQAIGFRTEDLVLSDQIHETVISYVTKEDCQGSDLTSKKMSGIDGLVTDQKNVVLATSYADCVPLFFVDPQQKAIGSAHAGWRGTVGGIGRLAVRKMQEQFGSSPEDLRAVIGPSICADCYEISEEVAEAFRAVLPEENVQRILIPKGSGKYQLDLWLANRIILEDCGVLPEHIEEAGICTYCNHELLFSHRYTKGKRGNLNGFLALV